MLNSDPFTRGKINTGGACTFLKPSGGVCIEISHENSFCLLESFANLKTVK
jgi:hypothetical protein